MRVLVVEDQPDAALVLAKALRENGYAVDVNGDGESACVSASVNDYDVIVLDVMLPKHPGEHFKAASRTQESSWFLA